MKTNWKERLSPEDWQRFFGNELAWRNDDHPEDSGTEPTVSCHVHCATDRQVGKGTYYSFGIRHVRGFHGKGFMAFCVFNSMNSWCANGEIFYGTSSAAYQLAKREGQQLIERLDAEMAKDLEDHA